MTPPERQRQKATGSSQEKERWKNKILKTHIPGGNKSSGRSWGVKNLTVFETIFGNSAFSYLQHADLIRDNSSISGEGDRQRRVFYALKNHVELRTSMDIVSKKIK